MALTLCQQQHPNDVLFHLQVNKVTYQKGLLMKNNKEYELTQNFHTEKHMSVKSLGMGGDSIE